MLNFTMLEMGRFVRLSSCTVMIFSKLGGAVIPHTGECLMSGKEYTNYDTMVKSEVSRLYTVHCMVCMYVCIIIMYVRIIYCICLIRIIHLLDKSIKN